MDEAGPDYLTTDSIQLPFNRLEQSTALCEFDELDWDEQNEAVQAIRENDTSDPVSGLLRNTPDQLMRTRLGTPIERLTDPSAAWGSNLDTGGAETRKKALLDLLKDHGADIESEGVSEALDELIEEGPWDWHEGVRLDLIFTGDLEEMAAAPRVAGAEIQNKQLTFTSPRVLLIDPWNGSGHEVSVPVTVVKVLPQPSDEGGFPDGADRVSLDSNAGGYSWDRVAGVVQGAYKPWAPSAQWLSSAPDEG
ncbi:hypothetical protein [Pseudarthrobacter sp. AB1]|uniref:hypothetical protein n=1 Tax=Pseudarthrobacter sp. AB1 TaxID=2138309 RepID=UPI00186B6DE9|nr:hypothetical protein [Pseudarthrobacter sp. AB1]MBE4719501.1 hypothetical protein [Pseudarthrobacter sp. AB1]